MQALDFARELPTVAPPDDGAEAVALGARITRLQARITADRRRMATLHAQRAAAAGADDAAALAARIVYLENDLAQHEVELAWWVARLEGLQPRRDRPQE